MNKLIFLDIDGVLDTYASRYQLDPVLMARLGTLLERSGAKIVVSSSWRAMDVAGTIEFGFFLLLKCLLPREETATGSFYGTF